MTWPLPVVSFTAEIANAACWCIDQTDVFDFELLLKIISVATKIGAHVATAIGLLFTCSDQALAICLKLVKSGQSVQLGCHALVHG